LTKSEREELEKAFEGTEDIGEVILVVDLADWRA